VERKRLQTGCVVKIGGIWNVRYADWRIENGERIRKQNLTHKLAPVQDSEVRLKRPPKYIEKLQAEFIERVNGSVENPENCSTMTQFVESAWLPFIEQTRIVHGCGLPLLLEAPVETLHRQIPAP
jgi:hypothetical protein